VLLAVRPGLVAEVSAAAVTVAGRAPATPAMITGALTWLVLTARHDLAPPLPAGQEAVGTAVAPPPPSSLCSVAETGPEASRTGPSPDTERQPLVSTVTGG
jgi:hypothetical protein